MLMESSLLCNTGSYCCKKYQWVFLPDVYIRQLTSVQQRVLGNSGVLRVCLQADVQSCCVNDMQHKFSWRSIACLFPLNVSKKNKAKVSN